MKRRKVISINEAIAEAQRELKLRKSVYSRKVNNGSMCPIQARKNYNLQIAIIDYLKRFKQLNEGSQSSLKI